MKRYKLLKDLPYAKAGEVFERKIYKSKDGLSDYDYLEIRKRVNIGEDETCFGIKYNDFLNNFNEWFEEIKEIGWKPGHRQEYWFIADYSIISQTIWFGDSFDNARYDAGNCYQTKKEAEKARDRKLAEIKLRRTSTFKPDFKNGKGGWAICYDYYFEQLSYINCPYCDYGEPVRYETEEDAQKSIKENRQDWLIYFGVEE